MGAKTVNMKYFLCNLTWGRGSIGDEAILAGLLTKYDKSEVIVGSYTPAETASIYNVRAVNEQELLDVDTLVIGGGFVLPTSLKGLNELVDKYKTQGCRIEVRAIQTSQNIEEYLTFLRKADYITARYKPNIEALQKHLNAEHEQDFAFHCPSQKFEHNYHGWIGYNAIHMGGGGRFSETRDVQLPKGNIIGVANVRHKCDSREDDFVAIKNKNCDDYYYSTNPMEMKYLLSTLKCMYSQRKHLSLLSHLSGTPTYYFGKTEDNRELVKEWGVPVI